MSEETSESRPEPESPAAEIPSTEAMPDAPARDAGLAGEDAPTEVNAATPPGEDPAPVDTVPGLGEPSAPGHAPVPPQSDEAATPVPPPPVAPEPVGAPAAVTPPPVDAGQPEPIRAPGDETPSLTAGGHANPLGLPEIAVDRPEVGVGAAFAGGIVLALILKRLAR